MFARRGEQGSSVCPCARPGAWNAGVVGRGKRKPAVRLGLGRQGGAGAKAAPAGLPSALVAPITTADPRMKEVGTEDKPKQKPFPKLRPLGADWLTTIPFSVATDMQNTKHVGDVGHWANGYYRSAWLLIQECATNSSEWDAAIIEGGDAMFARDTQHPHPANQRKVSRRIARPTQRRP